MKNLKALSFLIGVSISSITIKAQSHHIWPASEDFSSFGRVIDILEVEKNVLLLQSLDLNTSYKVNKSNLNLLNLTNDKKSSGISFSSTNQYPSGMILLKDKTLVVNTTGEEFELKNLSYTASDFSLNTNSTIKGQFSSIPGGMVIFKSGAYLISSTMQYPSKEKYSNQLFRKNAGESFTTTVDDSKTTIEMLMKPKMLQYKFNPISTVTDTVSHTLGFQIVGNDEEKIINWSATISKTDPKPNKIICYNKELKEEWRVELSDDYGLGTKPIAMGAKNTWYLSSYQAQGKGITNSVIQLYDGKVASSVKANLSAFEVNGSLFLKNGDLCVYGFKTAPHPQAPEVILSSPLFYILDGKTLAVKKTWELSETDEPMKKLSELYGQTVYIAGKFYSATQLTDGSLVFGGHVIAPIVLLDETKSGQLTFNYVYRTSETYLK